MSHHSILVVDDDEDIRDVLSEALRGAGYDVRDAPNGRIALDEMRAHPPCLVLLDLMMPVMDGWQVAAVMANDPALSQIPVCVVTAQPAGAPATSVGVLAKPVGIRQLMAVVTEHCRE